MNPELFFTLNPSDYSKLIKFNKEFEDVVPSNINQVCEDFFNHFDDVLEQFKNEGKSIYLDLFDQNGRLNNHWHYIKTKSYIHPATMSFFAEILEMDVRKFELWAWGKLNFVDGELIKTNSIEDTLQSIANEIKLRNKHPLLINNDFLTKDLYFEFILIPPLSMRMFERNTVGELYAGMNNKVLLNLLGTNEMDLNYGTFVGMHPSLQEILLKYLKVILNPKLNEWDFTNQELSHKILNESNYNFEFYTPINTIENNLNTNKQIVFLNQEYVMKIERNEIFKIETVSGKVLKKTFLNDNLFPYYRKENDYFFKHFENIKFAIFNLDSWVFQTNEAVWPAQYELFEMNEISILFNQFNKTCILLNVGDYPIIQKLSDNQEFAWVLNKEFNGGIFNTKTGLLETETPLLDWHYIEVFKILTKNGLKIINEEDYEYTEMESNYVDCYDSNSMNHYDFCLFQEKWLLIYRQEFFFNNKYAFQVDFNPSKVKAHSSGWIYLSNEIEEWWIYIESIDNPKIIRIEILEN